MVVHLPLTVAVVVEQQLVVLEWINRQYFKPGMHLLKIVMVKDMAKVTILPLSGISKVGSYDGSSIM